MSGQPSPLTSPMATPEPFNRIWFSEALASLRTLVNVTPVSLDVNKRRPARVPAGGGSFAVRPYSVSNHRNGCEYVSAVQEKKMNVRKIFMRKDMATESAKRNYSAWLRTRCWCSDGGDVRLKYVTFKISSVVH